VAIADDGSGAETRAVVEAFAAAHPELGVRHVWHEDRGFRKNAILNRAIASSEADFLVFIDGDVLVRPDFLARHLELARPDRWASGSLIRLDAAATAAVTEELVASGRVFERDWLKEHGAVDRLGTWLKTRPMPAPVLKALDLATPVQKAWGGANSSAFREAILKVNGFDESMRYGGEDKELGVRLTNSGVRGRHLRYTASVVHLDHPRGYADPATIRANKARVRAARRSGLAWAADGIVKRAAP
jgi:cellulose synthase/poly-beta-1,6-N-acetylglucosamine synthase-like glycosyltransferase